MKPATCCLILLLIAHAIRGADLSSETIATLLEIQRRAIARSEGEIKKLEADLVEAKKYDTRPDEHKLKTLQAALARAQAALSKQRQQYRQVFPATQKAVSRAQLELSEFEHKAGYRIRAVGEISSQIKWEQDKLVQIKRDGVPRDSIINWNATDDEFGLVKRGDAGTLSHKDIKVQQIIDGNKMLISVSRGVASATLLLHAPTAGLVDDAPLGAHDDRLFMAIGTNQYRTVLGGTRTVAVLEELKPEDIREAIAKENAKNDK